MIVRNPTDLLNDLENKVNPNTIMVTERQLDRIISKPLITANTPNQVQRISSIKEKNRYHHLIKTLLLDLKKLPAINITQSTSPFHYEMLASKIQSLSKSRTMKTTILQYNLCLQNMDF